VTLAYQHRTRQLNIRASVLQILTRLWRTVDVTRLTETIVSFTTAGSLVVADGFRQSAAAAAAYYLATRPPGITTITVPVIDPVAPELTAAKLRGAGLSGIVNARRAGRPIEAALANGFVKVAGTASSLILDGGRETIMQTAQQDPAATGRWRRIAGPDSCAYCQGLAGQDVDVAVFASHDHCGCTAEPEFNRRP
jgi:hypothetical protein